MSEENVELVGRCVSSWIRSDFDPEEFLAEDIEWHAAPEEPEAGEPVLRGRENVYEAVTAWFEQLGPCDIEVTELLDCGSDVLVCSRMRQAGTVAWNPGYHLYTVTEGRVRRVRAFFHRDQVLKAAGLSE
jgi:ketosteroid isomerase-like protein